MAQTSSSSQGEVITLRDAVGKLPGPGGRPFAVLFEDEGLTVEIFAPRGVDTQQPHTRDEVYLIATGTGEFAYGDKRTMFSPGDFLFVPAGVAHRFENFSDDFVTWVLFVGDER